MFAKLFVRILPLMVLVGVAVLYTDTFGELFRNWMSDGNYAHGFAVMPIALYLAYRKREKLARIPLQPSVAGNLFLLMGLGLYVIGQWADIVFLGGLSFVIVVAGLVWTFAGFAMLKELAFPVAFLTFMTPPPDIFVEKVGAPLQRLSCSYATMLGGLFGMNVRSEGVTILINGMTFAVDVPCSGIRAINALVTLGALLGYFANTTIFRRIALFALAVPVAFAANVSRVFGVIAVANAISVKADVMKFHDMSGPVFFLFALSLMILVKRRFECSLPRDTCPT